MIKIFLVWIVFGFLYSNDILFKNQTLQSPMIEIQNMDTIGIEIKRQSFDSLILVYSTKIKEGNISSIDEHIIVIRIINTLNQSSYFDSTYKELINLYYINIFDKSVFLLQATPWKGGCYYSNKYDIFIGGKRHQNSKYLVKN
jgi:hypothetical protein